MLKVEKIFVNGTKCWKLVENFMIEAKELYVVHWRKVNNNEFREVIKTFQAVCPNHTEECYVVLAKSDLDWSGYMVFPHFEDAHRIHGILMLLGELEFWSETGLKPYITYLHDSAEKLVIRVFPNIDFVMMVMTSNYKKYV